MPFTRVCKLDEIEAGKLFQADLGAERLVLMKEGETIHATSRVCLHRGASLAGGQLEGSVVTCPLHFWKFDLKDGHCLQVPTSVLKTFPVKIENNEVYVDA